jgi:hypothetical protein
VHFRAPKEAIELLKTEIVEEISLDHDLGEDADGTGYDVILWIEVRGFLPPEIRVHTAIRHPDREWRRECKI